MDRILETKETCASRFARMSLDNFGCQGTFELDFPNTAMLQAVSAALLDLGCKLKLLDRVRRLQVTVPNGFDDGKPRHFRVRVIEG
ncbi:MAG: hypothetical protein ACAH95_06060 [Fimbriimonas sp.]